MKQLKSLGYVSLVWRNFSFYFFGSFILQKCNVVGSSNSPSCCTYKQKFQQKAFFWCSLKGKSRSHAGDAWGPQTFLTASSSCPCLTAITVLPDTELYLLKDCSRCWTKPQQCSTKESFVWAGTGQCLDHGSIAWTRAPPKVPFWSRLSSHWVCENKIFWIL